jgi:hypothetical protein
MSGERERPDLDIVREEMERLDDTEERERTPAPEPDDDRDQEERDGE